MEQECRYLEITMKDGTRTIWDAEKDGWCDCVYDEKFMIIKDKLGAWMGCYNLNNISSVVMKQ